MVLAQISMVMMLATFSIAHHFSKVKSEKYFSKVKSQKSKVKSEKSKVKSENSSTHQLINSRIYSAFTSKTQIYPSPLSEKISALAQNVESDKSGSIL